MIVNFKSWVFFLEGAVHWKTGNKLLKTVTKWNFAWIMSPLRHSCVTEPGMVWHKVKGTRDRIMGMGPCTEWCDKSVKYYARMFVTRVWIPQNTPMNQWNQMGDAHIHSLCLSKSKWTQNLHPSGFWRPQAPAKCCCSNSCHPVRLQATPWRHQQGSSYPMLHRKHLWFPGPLHTSWTLRSCLFSRLSVRQILKEVSHNPISMKT